MKIVSQNPERHQELNISDDLALKIIFWQGDTQKDTYLLSNPGGKLVRLLDGTNVYKLSSPQPISLNTESWVDTTTITDQPPIELPSE